MYNQFVNKSWNNINLDCYEPLLLPILYHTLMFPFHLLAIPFEILLFQNNTCISSDIISQKFIYFWMLPYIFYFIFSICFASVMESENNETQIKPVETMWLVTYLLQRQKGFCLNGELALGASLLFMLVGGFISSLPFLPLFMIYGQSCDE
jgi:hypothetical protein